MSPLSWSLSSLLVWAALVAAPEDRDKVHVVVTEDSTADRRAGASEESVEIVVDDPRDDWLFPGLDNPRVQAFFRSGSPTGGSLFDRQHPPRRRPLVRAGVVKVRGAEGGKQRRAARRFANSLVADARLALEACYEDSLARSPTDAVQLTFRVELDGSDRGAIQLARGVLGDVYGNACVTGVLEFADAAEVAKAQVSGMRGVRLEIPVWFWLQTAL